MVDITAYAEALVLAQRRAEAIHDRKSTDRICALKGGATQEEILEWDRNYPSPPPLVDMQVEAARKLATSLVAAAIRDLAREARERGDIGKDGGVEADTWLEARAKMVLGEL